MIIARFLTERKFVSASEAQTRLFIDFEKNKALCPVHAPFYLKSCSQIHDDRLSRRDAGGNHDTQFR